MAQTRKLLRQYGLRARKGLGQHFLVDDAVLETIVAAAALTPGDTVVEVGPGLGVLTKELAARAGRIIAVELDTGLASVLEKTIAPFGNAFIRNEDVLDIDPASLFGGLSQGPPPPMESRKVVANLPYYITSPVIRHFLEASVKPGVMVLMVQKEVAETIVAAPGRRSVLSISVQFYGEPSIVSVVPADSFYPAPEVDSAILRIDVYPHPTVDVDEEGFFRLVRAGFSASRKQAANSLAQGLGLPRTETAALLEKAGIETRRRAETFTIEEWATLWKVYTERHEQQ